MFTGFSEKTAEFLWGIRLNNSREWFTEHKQEYLEHVQAPLKALADDVWTLFIDKTGLDIGYRVSRVYKDARRVRSGGLYKDKLWFSLEKTNENWQATPVYFFEISPEGYSYGLGYYAASPEVMKRFRARLDAYPAEFERLASSLARQKTYKLTGDEYNRKKGDKEGVLADWYNRKTLAMIAERRGHDKLYSPAFAKTLCGDFIKLVPLYSFFWSLEGDGNP